MKSKNRMVATDVIMLGEIHLFISDTEDDLEISDVMKKLDPVLTHLKESLGKGNIGEWSAISKLLMMLDYSVMRNPLKIDKYLAGYKLLTEHILKRPSLIEKYVHKFVFISRGDWKEYLDTLAIKNSELLQKSILRKRNGELLQSSVIDQICCPADIQFILFQAIASNDIEAVKYIVSSIDDDPIPISVICHIAKNTKMRLSEDMVSALCDNENYKKSNYIKKMVLSLYLGDQELIESVYDQKTTPELGHYILKEMPQNVEIEPHVFKRIFSDGLDWYKALKIVKNGYVCDDIDTTNVNQKEKISFLLETIKSQQVYWRERTIGSLIARNINHELFIEHVKNRTDLSILNDILPSNVLLPLLTSHKKGKILSEDLGL